MQSRAHLVGTVSVAILALAGCASTGEAEQPSPSPAVTSSSETEPTPSDTPSDTASDTASAEPSPEPDAVADQLDLRAETVATLDDENLVGEASLTDAAAVVALLTELLGAPTTERVELGECVRPADVYRWGDDVTLTDSDDDILGDASLRILTGQLVSADGEPIAVTAGGGVQVGDDVSALIASADPAEVEGFSTSAIVIVDRGWPDEGFAAGAAAFTDNGIVRNIGTPIPVNSGLGC